MTRKVPANVTTTSTIEGWQIEAYLGPVAIHRVAGTGFFSDWAAGFSDFFGGRSNSYRQQLESLYQEAMIEALRVASSRGGNFILDFKVDFDEIAGKGKQMFMLTATGTAVHATRSHERPMHWKAGPGDISGSEVAATMRQKVILGMLKEGKNLTKDDMDFLGERKLPDAIVYALRIMPSSNVTHEVAGDAAQREIAYKYLQSLSPDATSKRLYEILALNPQLGNEIVSAIVTLDLVSYGKVNELLDSPNHDVRRNALQTLRGAPPVYREEDIDLIRQLIQRLPSSLLPRPRQVKKGTFGGEKAYWQCVCGREADPGKNCVNCGRDQMGIGESDVSPDQAVVNLRARMEALEMIVAASS